MDSDTDASAGMNVRRARRYAGLTLEQLAGRIGRSKGWLSMIENGRLALDKRSDIAAIAEACDVSADALLGQPAPEIQPGQPRYRLGPLREVLLDASLDDPPDIPARPVPVLGAAAVAADQALRNADYGALHRDLPPLIGELQVQAATAPSAEQEEALRLLIQACASAMIMLRHWGRTDLAWISADRGRQAAERLGNPVWKAAAAFECAMARPSANKPRVLLAAPGIADELEPMIGDDIFARQVYGMLRLSAALACAVQGDHGGAVAHGTEAAAIAEPLGDRPDAWELFGAANVGVWRAGLAVEAGDAGGALKIAAAVQPQALASSNRRAALRMERGRALAMLGGAEHDRQAVAEFRAAERLSPAQVHHNPLVRELVGNMLDDARRKAGGRELRGLAWRMGIRSA